MNSKNKKIVLHQMWTTKSVVFMIFMLFLSAGIFAQGKKKITGMLFMQNRIAHEDVEVYPGLNAEYCNFI